MDLKGCIIGLGNPGERYAQTRHNFGFLLADALLEQCRRLAPHSCSRLNLSKADGELYRLQIPGCSGEWLLLKPMTFMNESGRSAGAVANFYKLSAEQLLVLHDELDLPLGRMKLKQGGGAAGHNGLKSIAQHMGGNNFFRLRLGIGKRISNENRNFVLSVFSADERPLLDDVLRHAVEGVEMYAREGFVPAQQYINGFAPPEPDTPE